MSRIFTLGDFRKLTENLSDDFRIEMRVSREVPDSVVDQLAYPMTTDTDYQDGFEFDDVGVSDKVLCLSVTVAPEMCERIRTEIHKGK